MPALDGAGASVVRVASVARCWCGVATGVGGGGGGWAGGRGGRCGRRCSGAYIRGPSRCRGAGSVWGGGDGRGSSGGGG